MFQITFGGTSKKELAGIRWGIIKEGIDAKGLVGERCVSTLRAEQSDIQGAWCNNHVISALLLYRIGVDGGAREMEMAGAWHDMEGHRPVSRHADNP